MRFVNIRAKRDRATVDAAVDALFPAAACKQACTAIAGWAGYRPTPLHDLACLADDLGVGKITLKDESGRFGLGSFKALGGAYAVDRLVAAAGANGQDNITVIAATDGNHGRSVAWGARRAGARCVILVHPGVSSARRQAIAAYGAEVRQIDGSYDDTVRAALSLSADQGWFLVPDTTADEADPVAGLVMQGYTIMVCEIIDAWHGAPPTHIFVQAGVGGLAAAMLAETWRRWRNAVSRFVLVEPEAADCFLRSFATADRPPWAAVWIR